MSSANNETDIGRQFCLEKIEDYKARANRTKSEALTLFVTLVVCTLASPLFITLGDGQVLGKVIPSVLSSVATGCAVWLQQRRPQQLWALFRTTQRRLENEEIGFRFRINEYEKTDQPGKLLAQRTALICSNANDLWLPLVPNPDKVVGVLHPEETKTGG